MASFELIALNEATPQLRAPGAADTGVVSNLAVTTNLTATAGTANGVTYLNGSKVLTSGSGLQYDSAGRLVINAPAGAAAGSMLEVTANVSAQAISVFGRVADNLSDISFHPNASATVYASIQAGPTYLATFVSGTERTRATTTGLSVTGTLGVSGDVTLSAGTANGVAYLNGSKVITSGTGLQYNGTGLSITGTQSANLFSVNASGGGDQFQVSALAAGNGSVAASLNTGSSDYEPFRLIGEYLQFDTRTGVGTATERARIDSDGLKFNGDTAAANALDDYEEGTWTPTLTLTTPGTSSSSTPVGIYTKIGNTVFVQGRITLTKGTGSGDLVFGPLPFAANSTSGYQATAAISTDEFGVAGKIYNMFLQNSQTVPSLFSIAQAGGAGAAASASDFGASAISIRFSLTYHV